MQIQNWRQSQRLVAQVRRRSRRNRFALNLQRMSKDSIITKHEGSVITKRSKDSRLDALALRTIEWSKCL
jgi:hypothetical protein